MPSVIRTGLRVLSWPYSVAVSLRNMGYRYGLLPVQSVSVPVISIGNLTTGGTGKTPVVAWVCHAIEHAGFRSGIVSRGYRSDSTGENDEKKVLAKLCPSVPHEQNPNRIDAAEKLLAKNNVDAIVMDDGFQHRRLSRDLNIVLLDATNPFGFGFLLPRGLLRESRFGLRRADIVLITRADQISEQHLRDIEQTVEQVAPRLAGRVFRVAFKPSGLVNSAGESFSLSDVDDKDVAMMTAIGNPAAFQSTCKSLGARISSTHLFPDHHHYSEAELQDICKAAGESHCILTTLKDLVKIPLQLTAFRAVRIETAFTSDQQEHQFREVIQKTISDMNE